jgi:uncharacterized protein (DUF3820 family)
MRMKFGRFRGVEMGSIPKSYLRWLAKQPGLTDETRAGVLAALGIQQKTTAAHYRRPAFDARRAAAGDVD